MKKTPTEQMEACDSKKVLDKMPSLDIQEKNVVKENKSELLFAVTKTITSQNVEKIVDYRNKMLPRFPNRNEIFSSADARLQELEKENKITYFGPSKIKNALEDLGVVLPEIRLQEMCEIIESANIEKIMHVVEEVHKNTYKKAKPVVGVYPFTIEELKSLVWEKIDQKKWFEKFGTEFKDRFTLHYISDRNLSLRGDKGVLIGGGDMITQSYSNMAGFDEQKEYVKKLLPSAQVAGLEMLFPVVFTYLITGRVLFEDTIRLRDSWKARAFSVEGTSYVNTISSRREYGIEFSAENTHSHEKEVRGVAATCVIESE